MSVAEVRTVDNTDRVVIRSQACGRALSYWRAMALSSMVSEGGNRSPDFRGWKHITDKSWWVTGDLRCRSHSPPCAWGSEAAINSSGQKPTTTTGEHYQMFMQWEWGENVCNHFRGANDVISDPSVWNEEAVRPGKASARHVGPEIRRHIRKKRSANISRQKSMDRSCQRQ